MIIPLKPIVMKKLVFYSILIIFNPLIISIGFSQQSEQTSQELLVIEGTTVREQVYSPGLEGNLLGDASTQFVKVYLPPGYHDYPDNRYPVVYLLHGHTQDYNSYYSSYGLLNRLNDMISGKIIKPMIVVTPNGKNKYTGSMYTNSSVSGNWEDFIVQDVVQFVEGKYQILNQPQSRGLGGFSSGGYGTIKLAMKHPSVYKSICTIGISIGSFEEKFLVGSGKESIIAAAKVDKWSAGLPWKVKNRWSNAVAFAPDPTALPVLGRFPFTTEGVFIDSIWQKWLVHDPVTMLQTHRDSMLQLAAIQMYVGNKDFVLPQNNIFHQALIDSGIDHGFQNYSGDHDPRPVLNKLLVFFSENLKGIIPNITLNNDYLLTVGETLLAETDMAGSVYIVPDSISAALDSITKYNIRSVETVADSLYEIELGGIPFGHYKVYGVSDKGGVSIFPGEFTFVPDTTLPVLNLDSDTVIHRDTILASINRDGTIYLVKYKAQGTISQITDPDNLVASTQAQANEEVGFTSEGMVGKSYWVYGVDQYDIVSEPRKVYIQKGPYDERPVLSLISSDSLITGDTIRAAINIDGMIFIVRPDTPRYPEHMTKPENFIDSISAKPDTEVIFYTEGLAQGSYWLLGMNRYNVVSLPQTIYIQTTSTAVPISSVDIIIFPNPSDGTITIRTSGQPPFEIEIYTLKGHLIYSAGMERNSSQIDLSPIQRGVYIITLRSKDFVTTRKIIKL